MFQNWDKILQKFLQNLSKLQEFLAKFMKSLCKLWKYFEEEVWKKFDEF